MRFRPLALTGFLLAASFGAGAAQPAKPDARESRASRESHAPNEPLSLDEVEIRGERLVPQAVYIVGGPETDAEAAATVGDYLLGLAPAPERVPLCLILVPDDAAPAE